MGRGSGEMVRRLYGTSAGNQGAVAGELRARRRGKSVPQEGPPPWGTCNATGKPHATADASPSVPAADLCF